MLIALEEARTLIDRARFRTARAHEVPTVRAIGRIVARPVRAVADQPSRAQAAMDGFAVRPRGSGPNLTFRVDPAGPLQPGHARYVTTGAAVPTGTRAVVRVEIARQDGDLLRVLELPAKGTDVRVRGEDVRRGEELLSRGRLVRPLELGLLLSQGIHRVPVVDLRVGLLAIGDEILPPTSRKREGVRDSITPVLEALLSFARTRSYGPVRDRPRQIADRLREAARWSDLVITVGGSSVGARDYTKRVVRELGELLFEGVRLNVLKRGGLGRVGRTPVLILPGQVVSALTVFHEHGLHVLSRLVGRELRRVERLPLGARVEVHHRMDTTFLFRIENGRAFPLRWGVGLYSELSRAAAFGVLPRGRHFDVGEEVTVQSFGVA